MDAKYRKIQFMKHLKTFEDISIDEPKIGDYIHCKDKML